MLKPQNGVSPDPRTWAHTPSGSPLEWISVPKRVLRGRAGMRVSDPGSTPDMLNLSDRVSGAQDSMLGSTGLLLELDDFSKHESPSSGKDEERKKSGGYTFSDAP